MAHISIKLDTPCELINLTPLNPLISKCQIKVCYVGDAPNRNRSVITKDVAREMANSLPGSPIVGYYNEEKGDFEEHNRVIDISNGKFEIKDTTRPYGFVDLNAKCWFQKFEDDGIIHEYLMTEGYLWTGQYPEAQRIIDKGNNHSMELDEELIDAYWTKDGNGKPQFFIINEAIISKLCILGEECEPCFEGSNITAPQITFSFEDGFKEQLFSMIQEMQKILNEGGAPVFTTYAVEIGDALWTALYDYLVNNFSDDECEFCSVYRIEGIYEEEGQKFAILQHRTTMDYFRMDFAISEEGFNASENLLAVSKEFVPATESQFGEADYQAYALSYAESKKEQKEDEVCEKCGKPKSECTCEDENEDEDKKDKYVLEEIPEYMELNQKYSALQTDYAALEEAQVVAQATESELRAQIAELTQFKNKIEKKEKEDMIYNTFAILSDADKKDVIDNIDTYSLEEIEAKLSIFCVRNKVSFSEDDEHPAEQPFVYHVGGFADEESATPAWVKAVLAKQNKM